MSLPSSDLVETRAPTMTRNAIARRQRRLAWIPRTTRFAGTLDACAGCTSIAETRRQTAPFSCASAEPRPTRGLGDIAAELGARGRAAIFASRESTSARMPRSGHTRAQFGVATARLASVSAAVPGRSLLDHSRKLSSGWLRRWLCRRLHRRVIAFISAGK